MKTFTVKELKALDSVTFFKSLGWKYISVGSYEWDWVKLDGRGKVIAHLGDQTWVKDMRKWTAKKKSLSQK